MEYIRKRDRHTKLMTTMAETVGTDLEEARMRGALDDQDEQTALQRCIGCLGGANCPDWLEQHADGSEDTPEYCRNRALFAQLRS